MDTSETYIKMREKAIPYIGRGEHPKSDLKEYMEQVIIAIDPSTGSLYYTDGLKVFQLERQDQLQEMLIPSRYKEKYDMCSVFAAYLHDKPDIMSMEQLWLAFVMKERYNKTWNGEEWQMY